MSGVARWERSQEHTRDHYRGWPATQQANKRLGEFGCTVEDFDSKVVLEVGSGAGIVHGMADCTTIGIDPLSSEWADRYQDTAADGVLTGVGEALPLATASIDAVFTWNVLDHCLDPASVLDEIHRVLKPDGELLICVNTYDVPPLVLNVVVKRLGRNHPNYFRPADVQSLIDGSRFAIEWDRIRCLDVDPIDKLRQRDIMTVGAVAFRLRYYMARCTLGGGS